MNSLQRLETCVDYKKGNSGDVTDCVICWENLQEGEYTVLPCHPRHVLDNNCLKELVHYRWPDLWNSLLVNLGTPNAPFILAEVASCLWNGKVKCPICRKKITLHDPSMQIFNLKSSLAKVRGEIFYMLCALGVFNKK